MADDQKNKVCLCVCICVHIHVDVDVASNACTTKPLSGLQHV